MPEQNHRPSTGNLAILFNEDRILTHLSSAGFNF